MNKNNEGGGMASISEVKSNVNSIEHNPGSNGGSTAKPSKGAGGVNSGSGSVSAGWKPSFDKNPERGSS